MKILVVGAGAVGMVYGRYLQRAGHEVHFFIKEKYAAELANGMSLHHLKWRNVHSELWRDFGLVTTTEAVASTQWDQVWFAISTDALRSDLTWTILDGVGSATVVCLQPGPADAEYTRQHLGNPAQMVQGLITFLSYQSPLPGTNEPEGISYFLPPMTPGLFSGESSRVNAVVDALKKGGMSARIVDSLDRAAGGSPALLIPLVAALEYHDWKLSGMAGSAAFALGKEAAREALAVVARSQGAETIFLRQVLRRPVAGIALAVAPRIMPLPLETYLKYHFSKVGVQTRQVLEEYAELGARAGLPTGALRRLRAALP